MRRQLDITQDAFDRFLTWLDPDRERAGEKYEEIRRKLIKIFARRGCTIAEDLCDEAINRVSRRVKDIAESYVGDPALYFYGVAQNVYLEYVKKRPDPKPLPTPDPPDEQRHKCLEKCIGQLDSESQEIILQYYQEERRAKIDHRKELADRLGITLNGLRMRVHRIKATLQKCVFDCVSAAEAG
jgi:RNA polymerase sigma factor (sigma-70 family)